MGLSAGGLVDSAFDCVACSDGFDCVNGTELSSTLLLPGFYRHSPLEQSARRCPEYISGSKTCIGGGLAGDANCHPAHRGPFCSLCKDGFGKTNDLCKECRQSEKAWLDYLFIGLAGFSTFLVVVVIVRLKHAKGMQLQHNSVKLKANAASGKAKGRDEQSSASLTSKVRIVMNWVQLTSLARELKVQFDCLMSRVLEAQDSVGSAGFWRMNAFNCRLPLNFYQRYLFYALTPVASVLLPFGFQLCTRLVRRARGMGPADGASRGGLLLGSLRDAAGTIWVLLVVSYTPVIRVALSVFKCT